eukprot:gene1875-7946_t
MVVTAVLVVMTMVPSVRNPVFPCSQRHQERRRLRHLALLPGRRDHGVGVELQTSQAALVSNADPSAPWNNDYFGKNSLLGGWHFNLPIPFASSVRVTLQLPAWFPGCDDRIFAMVRGVENYPVTVAGFNLPPAARLVASVVNASLAPLEFHNLVTDYPESAYYLSAGPWRGPTAGLTVMDKGTNANTTTSSGATKTLRTARLRQAFLLLHFK